MAKSVEKDPGTAVAKPGTAALTKGAVDLSLILGDAAAEAPMTRADIAIPFLKIAQKMHPHLNPRDPAYVPGLVEGDFFDPVTGERWPGQEGVLVVVAEYQRTFLEWKPNRGGFVRDHGNNEALALAGTEKNEKGKNIVLEATSKARAGNEVAETMMYYLLVVNPQTGDFVQKVFGMTATHLKYARRWNTKKTSFRVMGPNDQLFMPGWPYLSWKITTVQEQNDLGSWMSPKIEQSIPTLELPNGEALYLAARDFAAAIRGGEVRARVEDLDQGGDTSDRPLTTAF